MAALGRKRNHGNDTEELEQCSIRRGITDTQQKGRRHAEGTALHYTIKQSPGDAGQGANSDADAAYAV